jgi:transposase-like protein
MEGIAYLWNVMDRKTRFLLASKLSKHRDDDGAIRALLEAKRNAHESQPQIIFTDALRSYREGISYAWFNDKRPKHIAKAGIRKPNATNNRIERLNGTLRERVKVQRGWKSMKTPIAEGQRSHYNFVKPHQALEGQTPAQRAGLVVEGENKWLELLMKALSQKTGSEIAE